MPTWFTHGWQAWFIPPPPPCQLPPGAGPAGEGIRDSMSAPPPTTGPGRNPECAAPTLGGPPQDPPITSYWQSWSWERSGESRLGPTAARWRAPGRGHFPPGATPWWGPWSTPGLALVGWARGSVYRQPSLWRREPRGEGGAGASDWKSEALGSACLMKERGANGDTEILIRGSLWGGIYYSALIGCVVASQHPGPGPGATKL